MATCTDCSAALEPQWKFCVRCGAFVEPRWSSLGLWDISDVRWTGQIKELTLDHPALLEASDVLLRPVEP